MHTREHTLRRSEAYMYQRHIGCSADAPTKYVNTPNFVGLSEEDMPCTVHAVRGAKRADISTEYLVNDCCCYVVWPPKAKVVSGGVVQEPRPNDWRQGHSGLLRSFVPVSLSIPGDQLEHINEGAGNQRPNHLNPSDARHGFSSALTFFPHLCVLIFLRSAQHQALPKIHAQATILIGNGPVGKTL